jgi:hypothetical protein
VQKFASTISAASEKHGKIFSDCDSENFVSMNIGGTDKLIVNGIILNKSSLIGAIVHAFIESTPLDIVDHMVSWSFDFFFICGTSFFLSPS